MKLRYILGKPKKYGVTFEACVTNVFNASFLEISQTFNLETYSQIECRKYPNKEFYSYNSCDESYVYDLMKSFGVMPFWATHNLNEVTNLT